MSKDIQELNAQVSQEANYKKRIDDNHTMFMTASQNGDKEPVFWFSTTTKDGSHANLTADNVELATVFMKDCIAHFNSNHAWKIAPESDQEL